MGVLFLIIFFSLPVIYLFSKKKKWIPSKWINLIENKKTYYENAIVLLYISSVVSLSSLFGSFYPSVIEKTTGYWKRIYETLLLVGESAWVLLFPLIVASFLLDNMIKKFSSYLLVKKGLIDTTIGQANIALRKDTFFNIIEAIGEDTKVCDVAKKIAEDYTNNILEFHRYINCFEQFIDKWIETDQKAGFIESINTNENTIHINLPMSLGADQVLLKSFFKCYYTCIIKTYYKNVEQKYKNIELISEDSTNFEFSINDNETIHPRVK